MKRIIWLLFTLFTLPQLVFCQEAEKPLERPAGKLTLALDGERAINMTIQQTPYVKEDGSVQILPGETIFIEIDFKEGRVSSLRVVSKIVSPEKTVTLKFEQTVTGGERPKHDQMILTISNPFNKTLVYRAKIFSFIEGDVMETNVIPVMAGIQAIEMWREVLGCVFLYDFRLKEGKE